MLSNARNTSIGMTTGLPLAMTYLRQNWFNTKLVLELIRETARCTQKDIIKTDGKDQGQVSKAINRHV
jgi:hypothetical protein